MQPRVKIVEGDITKRHAILIGGIQPEGMAVDHTSISALEGILVISLHCFLGILADVFNPNCGLLPCLLGKSNS